jgi:hypothetical protein
VCKVQVIRSLRSSRMIIFVRNIPKKKSVATLLTHIGLRIPWKYEFQFIFIYISQLSNTTLSILVPQLIYVWNWKFIFLGFQNLSGVLLMTPFSLNGCINVKYRKHLLKDTNLFTFKFIQKNMDNICNGIRITNNTFFLLTC